MQVMAALAKWRPGNQRRRDFDQCVALEFAGVELLVRRFPAAKFRDRPKLRRFDHRELNSQHIAGLEAVEAEIVVEPSEGLLLAVHLGQNRRTVHPQRASHERFARLLVLADYFPLIRQVAVDIEPGG